MAKNLSDMTLEELWELFPIVLTEHKAEWTNRYEEMATVLRENLSAYRITRISHIGSTAIASIWAKPIVDILIEIASDENVTAVSEQLSNSGFIKMSESGKRISFNLGYTPDGFADSVFHIHLRFTGDNDELYFRDYLNEYPDVASMYEKLKLSLWHKYEHNRDAYTEAKTEFINKYTAIAKKQYTNRYRQNSI